MVFVVEIDKRDPVKETDGILEGFLQAWNVYIFDQVWVYIIVRVVPNILHSARIIHQSWLSKVLEVPLILWLPFTIDGIIVLNFLTGFIVLIGEVLSSLFPCKHLHGKGSTDSNVAFEFAGIQVFHEIVVFFVDPHRVVHHFVQLVCLLNEILSVVKRQSVIWLGAVARKTHVVFELNSVCFLAHYQARPLLVQVGDGLRLRHVAAVFLEYIFWVYAIADVRTRVPWFSCSCTTITSLISLQESHVVIIRLSPIISAI